MREEQSGEFLVRASRSRLLSGGHCLRPAQEFDVELATGEQHIVQRFVDIAGLDATAAIAGDAGLGDAPHQLLDKGGAHAFGPLRGLTDDRLAERQAFTIQPHEFFAAGLVRQRHFDRLVDAAGATRERALKLLRTVGGEDEQDVASCFSPSISLRSALSSDSSHGPIRSRSRAMRSTSSITTIAGCNRRARFM